MAESFETYRPYLFAIAYRMLGSAMDAEDMVQETYLRYQGTPLDTIRSLKAFLTTIITRLCVDQLQLARRKREVYVGPWLPEPILTATTPEAGDPERRVDMEESISLAFLMLLEQLQPFERAVFLLREVFEYDFAEIATMLGKTEAACRRSFSRAKKHLSEHRPRFPPSPQTHRQMLTGFFQAAQGGDMTPLMDLLSEEVTLWADGGVELSCFLVVSDYARALAFYRDVLGATVVRELPGTLGFLNFRGSQILLSAPGGPTKDQQAPGGNLAIGELTMRVPDCSAAYEVLRSRGAEFITPPVEWGDEIRAFFHDPDGHLLEIAETREAPERSW